MQTITITGNLGGDAEVRAAGSSDVANFSVGVRNGFGQDANTIWYRCALWGKPARAFEQSLKKGAKITVSGALLHDEYQGKPQFKINVNELDVHERREQQSSGGGGGYAGPEQGGFDDGLDDDCPFVRIDHSLGGRRS